ncbi:DNA (cytosine-5)-methyltransferase 1 [Dyella jiangningensis]|uniref:DNA cytosine methyltransferase n=1 Tax=Dyella sp. AtDHG13 TaxID=1938897 RepID=UPI00088683C1|nr:DNA cytosine methyltransferase [Dyella sp. AtDHG13]PXV60705.1 DNA (cytosine-5)-methyltransferase 1 [Dyella sp. AtDHG13]SDJ55857.1 DNA (cytosine-5)-methyltransferase 1 [Dyella jiangningensis]
MGEPITYGSVCSGIEAVTVAMEPEGWRADWFAEIEPFPCSVLAHHYPAVPNLGDMTTIALRVLKGDVRAPDVLVGGTPCQAFSVAGTRNSLADERGNLTLRYVELANAIDDVRTAAGNPAAVIWWENVPGVLSTKDNAFGCFLAGLAGSDGALEPPVERPAVGKSSRYWKWDKERKEHVPAWANVGAVYGPRRAIAWRTLDAQYFGLAQRRRRVFVVASARDGFDPATVLLEWDRMRRDSAPRRQEGQGTAASLTASAGHHGHSSPRGDGSDNLIAGTLAGGGRANGGYSYDDVPLVSGTLQASGKAAGSATQQDAEAGMLVAFSCKDYGADAGNLAPTLRAMGHQGSHPNAGGQIAVAFQSSQSGMRVQDTHATLDANNGSRRHNGIADSSGVRRLTPRECERLQGFPDDYTLIEVRGKPAADGPRYKALGNSMATNVIRWIGLRITAALTLNSVMEAA